MTTTGARRVPSLLSDFQQQQQPPKPALRDVKELLACNFCKKKNTKLKKCTQCKMQWYCNSQCQSGDWPQHKPFCVRVKNKSKEAASSSSSSSPSSLQRHQRPQYHPLHAAMLKEEDFLPILERIFQEGAFDLLQQDAIHHENILFWICKYMTQSNFASYFKCLELILNQFCYSSIPPTITSPSFSSPLSQEEEEEEETDSTSPSSLQRRHLIDVNEMSSDGETLFGIMASKTNLTESNLKQVCRLLQKHGAKVNLIQKGSYLPIHFACFCCNAHFIKWYLKRHTRYKDIYSLVEGLTPSHCLCLAYESSNFAEDEEKIIQCLSLFIEKESNLNLLTRRGDANALILAYQCKRFKVVSFLKENGVTLIEGETLGASITTSCLKSRNEAYSNSFLDARVFDFLEIQQFADAEDAPCIKVSTAQMELNLRKLVSKENTVYKSIYPYEVSDQQLEEIIAEYEKKSMDNQVHLYNLITVSRIQFIPIFLFFLHKTFHHVVLQKPAPETPETLNSNVAISTTASRYKCTFNEIMEDETFFNLFKSEKLATCSTIYSQLLPIVVEQLASMSNKGSSDVIIQEDSSSSGATEESSIVKVVNLFHDCESILQSLIQSTACSEVMPHRTRKSKAYFFVQQDDTARFHKVMTCIFEILYQLVATSGSSGMLESLFFNDISENQCADALEKITLRPERRMLRLYIATKIFNKIS